MTGANRIGLTIGGAFTGAVIGLLVFLHASTPVVEFDDRGLVGSPLRVCMDAPAWARHDAGVAAAWWAERGYPVGSVAVGLCEELCETTDGPVECLTGGIAVAPKVPGSGGVARTYHGAGWATVTVPDRIEAADPTSTIDAPPLPKDVGALVLAHELGEALGLSHEATPVGCGVVGRMTGHVLNPTVTAVGWGDAGVPPGPGLE